MSTQGACIPYCVAHAATVGYRTPKTTVTVTRLIYQACSKAGNTIIVLCEKASLSRKLTTQIFIFKNLLGLSRFTISQVYINLLHIYG